MSAMRRAMQYFGFDVADRNDYDYDYADEELAPVTHINDVAEVRERAQHRSYEAPRQARPRATEGDLRRIQTLKPRTYADAKTIGEAFRQGVPVIMNLTEMNEAEARRMVDYSAGLAHGLHGRLERVTTAVFLLSPSHVEIGLDEEPTPQRESFFAV